MFKIAHSRRVFALFLPLLLWFSACGGGGSGGGGTAPPPPSPSEPTFTLSGTITAPSSSATDSDVNDPSAPYASNDSIAEAQPISTPITLGGYVNVAGTGPPGRSGATGDESDFFTAILLDGQVITLNIADPASADLELFLLDSNGVIIDSSLGDGAIESITVPADGIYFIKVFACGIKTACGFDSASTYVLTIGQQLAGAGAPDALRLSSDFVAGEAIVRFRDKVLPAGISDNLQSRAKSVGLEPSAGAGGREMLLSIGAKNQNTGALSKAFDALGITPGERFGRMTFSGPQDALKVDTLTIIKALRARADVLTADPNYIKRPSIVPNDPRYSLQWHYPLINLPQAWDLTTGSPNVLIAVIDTGILSGHPDFAGKLTAGYDFISDIPTALDGDGIDPDPEDPGDESPGASTYHGTVVAGIAGAATSNATGIAGVGWQARIMPLRVLGKDGGTTFDLLQALRYAAGIANDSGTLPASKADVINLSLGGGSFSQSEQNVYNAVTNTGAIIVSSAGNQSSNVPKYPASYGGVVSVSAVTILKGLASYSNTGSTIDVAAPGGQNSTDVNGDGNPDGILTTWGKKTASGVDFIYAFAIGTSVAAPHVSGVAALMKTVHPALTPAEFDGFLSSGAITEDLGTPGRDDTFGHGLIDAFKAVAVARVAAGGPPPPPNPTLVINPASLNMGPTQTTVELTAANGGAGSLTISTVVSDEVWLGVAPDSIDNDGLGSYAVSVDRTGLAVGPYSGTITFASDVNTIVVPVFMQVTEGSLTGDAGFHYVTLIDADTSELVETFAVGVVDGVYEFTFEGVFAGSYFLFAGTDADNDLLICDAGEACGAFVTLDQPMPFDVDADQTGLDFDTNFVVNLGGAGGTGKLGGRPGLSRTETKKVFR